MAPNLVTLSAGTFTLATPAALPASSSLTLQGVHLATILTPSTDTHLVRMRGNGQVVRDLTFRDTAHAQTSTAALFFDSSGGGLYDCRVDNVFFDEVFYGLWDNGNAANNSAYNYFTRIKGNNVRRSTISLTNKSDNQFIAIITNAGNVDETTGAQVELLYSSGGANQTVGGNALDLVYILSSKKTALTIQCLETKLSNIIADLCNAGITLTADAVRTQGQNIWSSSHTLHGLRVEGGGNHAFTNYHARLNGTHGIYLTSNTTHNRFLNANAEDNSITAADTSSGLRADAGCTYTTIFGGLFRDTRVGGARTQRIGIDLANTNNNTVLGAVVLNNITGPVVATGAGNIIRANPGYVTENSGTATIASGATSVVVTHGLAVTPTLDDISVMAAENATNDHGPIWVSTITSTQFTVNCRLDPGASNLDLAWRAVVL